MSTVKTDAIETRAGGTSVLTIGTATQTIKLPGGTPGAGKLLQSDADGDASWATVANDVVLLSTQTASTSASVNFDNTLITSDYRTYDVRYMNVVGATDGVSLEMQFSDDNGSNFDSNHMNNMAVGYAGAGGSGLTNNPTNDSVLADHARFGADQSFDAGDSMGGTATIQNPSSTSSVTTYQNVSSHVTFNAANVYAYNTRIGGYWASLAAVNYIRFRMSSGDLATGIFQLWGYK